MEKDNNIILSCSEHGKEQYFKIQKLGSVDPTQTYVWFEDKNNGVERMWVKVVTGNNAGEVIKGPFCECCGDPIEEETGIKKAELH